MFQLEESQVITTRNIDFCPNELHWNFHLILKVECKSYVWNYLYNVLYFLSWPSFPRSINWSPGGLIVDSEK